MTSLLATIAERSHKTETVLARRFPRAETELPRLLVAGYIELHSIKPRAWRITMCGRAYLRRLREADRAQKAKAA